jgi:uncharacterized protein involved in outer membrane biogenesis
MAEAAPPPPPKPLLRRWSVRILLVLVALGVAGLLLKNVLIRRGLEEGVTEATGFPLEIDSFDLGLFDARVDVKGLRLSNPPGFEDLRCLEAPRLLADVDLASAFGKVLHVEAIDLDVKEVVVVKNAKGETNLDRLEALARGDEGKAPAGEEPAEPRGGKKDRKWRCDRFHLRLDRVVLVDYAEMRKGKPKTEVFELGIDEVFKDVRGPKHIVRLIVRKVLAKTPVKLLAATAESLAEGIGDSIGDRAKDALGGILGGEPKPEPDPEPKPARKKKR